MTLSDIFPFLLMLAALLAILIMNQRRTKQQHDLEDSLVEGDEVVLHSGIHGFVASVDANVIWLEVAEGTEMKVSKTAIQTVMPQNG